MRYTTGWLRSQEKKDLLKRITLFIGKKLHALNQEEGWTYQEISERTGVPFNRISEYIHYDKYQRNLTKGHLAMFIRTGGGIMTEKEVVDTVEANENEKKYIHEIAAVEDNKVKKYIAKIQDAGLNIGDFLEEKWNEYEAANEKKK